MKEATAWRTEAEAMAQTLLVNDWSGPVYIVPTSELPDGFPRPGCLGLVARGLDVLLRDAIGNRWRGRGAAVVIANDLPGDEARWGVLVHELAHVIADAMFPRSDDGPELVQLGLRYLADMTTRLPDTMESSIERSQHGQQFVRAAAHLANRAAWLGCPANPRWVLDHTMYGTPPLRLVQSVLATEIFQRARDPLMDVLSGEPPAEFAWLFSEFVPIAREV